MRECKLNASAQCSIVYALNWVFILYVVTLGQLFQMVLTSITLHFTFILAFGLIDTEKQNVFTHWHSLTLSITYAAWALACFNTSLKWHDAYTKWNIQTQDAMFFMFLWLHHCIKWKTCRCLIVLTYLVFFLTLGSLPGLKTSSVGFNKTCKTEQPWIKHNKDGATGGSWKV